MGRKDSILLPFLLQLHLCSAFLPSGRLSCSKITRMAGMRRRAGRGAIGDGDDEGDDGQGIGMFLWRGMRRRSPGAAGDATRSTSVIATPSSTKSISSSLIHLGKLRIPQSRRIQLNPTRSTSDASRGTTTSIQAVQHDPGTITSSGLMQAGLSAGQRGSGDRDKDREKERKIEIDEVLLARSHPVIVGPSVIPYGVGKEETQRGVVQIPEHFTVGQTVEFIKTIATVDRDFRRAAVPVVASEDKDEHLREQEPGRLHGDARSSPALTDRIYVTEDGKLKGYITMAALLTNEPQTPVLSLLRRLEELLREGDSWEDAAHRVRQAHVMAAPVVDAEGVLVAVLNPNDLLHEMEIEATDDIMRQSGSGGGESYFGTPLGRLVASRVGWLLGLLCLQSFSSLILQSFQNVIERNMVIALFLTMLTGTAGNAGNQSSAIVIRGLATGEITRENRLRVVWREARAAVASAAVLSVASFVRVLLTPGATTIATLAVSVAMGATVIGAVMFGTIAPIALHGMGVDPVNFASPALATLTDVSGVFILCSVAKLMLGST